MLLVLHQQYTGFRPFFQDRVSVMKNKDIDLIEYSKKEVNDIIIYKYYILKNGNKLGIRVNNFSQLI